MSHEPEFQLGVSTESQKRSPSPTMTKGGGKRRKLRLSPPKKKIAIINVARDNERPTCSRCLVFTTILTDVTYNA